MNVTINTLDAIQPSELATEMGITYATAVKYCKESNSAQKVGKVVFYSRQSIRVHLRAKHLNVLHFLGYTTEEA